MALKKYAVICVLVSAAAGCAHTSSPVERTPFEWVTSVCSNTQQSEQTRRETIQRIEQEQGFTFECPAPGEEPYIRWLDPEKAALAREAAAEREQPEPITAEIVDWINDVCARPPGPEREQALRGMKARGINATCPN
jgi:hypothetical protein